MRRPELRHTARRIGQLLHRCHRRAQGQLRELRPAVRLPQGRARDSLRRLSSGTRNGVSVALGHSPTRFFTQA